MNEAVITFKSKKDAETVVGGLSSPSKMPGYSYNIPASECKTGSVLRRVKGSVCEKCYACKGRYGFPNVQQALYRRYASLTVPGWVDAMVYLIGNQDVPYFRWHDSGDIQDLAHLERICDVARRLPNVFFWLPTKEKGLVNQYLRESGSFPENLAVRLSAPMIDMVLESEHLTSSVHKATVPEGHECPAPNQGNKCGDCRACWDKTVKNISYHNH